jgi:ketosteroid isomerase-like protein
MSQENVEFVRRVYDGWVRGDFSEGAEVFDLDVEFDLVDWPEGSSTRGLDEMGRTWRAALDAWEGFHAEPIEFIEAGEDVVVVRNRIEARGKESGADVRADTAAVWTLKAGKVVRLALYWNTSKALEAAGLSE